MPSSSPPPAFAPPQPSGYASRFQGRAVAAPQPARPGQRVLPLHRLDPVMQGFFREQIARGEVPYWIVADVLCIGYTSLTPYTAAGTDEPDWAHASLVL